MHEILKLQQKIVPELMNLLEKRYNILRTIYYNQPIGRRSLANKLEVGERIVRTEVNFLKEQKLISIGTPGMSVTTDGEKIIEKLKNFIRDFKGLTDIENCIREKLGIKKVIIVPGDMEEDETVIEELGRTAARYIESVIEDGNIIAITGGTTMKKVIDNFSSAHNYKNAIVVPARGGMARKVETEANTLAANFAYKLEANYKLLHVPDNLSSQTMNAILNENSIKEVIDTIRKADVIAYGIGRADEMSKRRGLRKEEISDILERGSVGEAFGYFFNSVGEVVCSTPSVGLRSEDIKNAKNLIAVAGGQSKAEAIVATEINNNSSVLVTDEGAAMEIVKLLKSS